MIQISIKMSEGTTEEWLKRRAKLPATLMRAAVAAARGLAYYVHEKYLNFPRSGPPQDNGLRHQTGRLGRAANATALGRPTDMAGTSFKAVWGVMDPNVPYAAKHEFGGTFQEQVQTYWRRSSGTGRSRAKTVRAKEGMGGGLIRVRGHVRTRTYTARRMFTRTEMEVGDRMVRTAGETALMLLNSSGNAPSGEAIRAALAGTGAPFREPR